MFFPPFAIQILTSYTIEIGKSLLGHVFVYYKAFYIAEVFKEKYFMTSAPKYRRKTKATAA